MQYFYVNTKLIKKAMNEKQMNIEQLSAETGISVYRLNGFIQGTIPRRGSLEIAIQIRLKLDIILEDMLTNKPPEN